VSLGTHTQNSTKYLKTTAERLSAEAIDSAVAEDTWTIRMEANGIFVRFMLKKADQSVGRRL